MQPIKRDIFSPPQTLNKYIIEEQIGKGVTCVVYKAIDDKTLETVAIKHVRVDPTKANTDTDDNKRRVVLNECEMLRQLNHKNIVKLLNSFEADGYLNLALEYLECGSVELLLKKLGKLSEATTRKVVYQILEALDYLGERRVAHRDIKGANLLLDKAGNVKLTDFGLAKLVNPGLINPENKNKCFVGTPYWMSPEMIQNSEGVTEATDIWSLGCTIIEMLTGKPPFSDHTHYQVFFMVTEKDVLFDTSGFSKDCADFLNLCLAKDYRQRPTPRVLMLHRWMAPEANLAPEGPKKLKQANSVNNFFYPPRTEKSINPKGGKGGFKLKTDERERSEANSRPRNFSRKTQMEISKKRSIILKGTHSDEFQHVKRSDEQFGSQGSRQSFHNLFHPSENDVLDEYTGDKIRPNKRATQRFLGDRKLLRESIVQSKTRLLPELSRKSRVGLAPPFPDTKTQTRQDNSNSRQLSVTCHKPRQQSCIQSLMPWDESARSITAEDKDKFSFFLNECSRQRGITSGLLTQAITQILSKPLPNEVFLANDLSILVDSESHIGDKREESLELVYEWLAKTFKAGSGSELLEHLSQETIIRFLRKTLVQLSSESVLIGQNLEVFKLMIEGLRDEGKLAVPSESTARYLKNSILLYRERVLSERYAGFYLDRILQLTDVMITLLKSLDKIDKVTGLLNKIHKARILEELLIVLLLNVDHKNKPKVNTALIDFVQNFCEIGLRGKSNVAVLEGLKNSDFLKILVVFAHTHSDRESGQDVQNLLYFVRDLALDLGSWPALDKTCERFEAYTRVQQETLPIEFMEKGSVEKTRKQKSRKADREKLLERT